MKFKTKEDLAKYAIEYFLKNRREPDISEKEVEEKLKEKGACFVTVYLKRELTGCIGSFQAYQPLYLDILKNAIQAAFFDPRFGPLPSKDLPNLKIEVSVLTPLKEYQPKNIQELINFLAKEKPGLMLGIGEAKALFLSQIWEELPTPEEFLANLCLKAGLPPNSWQEENMNFWIFYLKEDI